MSPQEINQRTLEQTNHMNLDALSDLVKSKLSGLGQLSAIAGNNDLVKIIKSKLTPQGKNGGIESSPAVKLYKDYGDLIGSLKFLGQKENMREFLHGLLVESQNFEDSDFCNNQLDLLNAGLVELPVLLSPLLTLGKPISPEAPESISSLKILDQIVKIDHITTRSITKDRFVQKCIRNQDQFKEVIKVSILKAMLFPEIFTDASLDLMSLGVTVYSLTENLKDQNFADSGAQVWQILSQIKDAEVDGVENSDLMKVDFISCQQAWLGERASILKTNGSSWGKSSSQKVRAACLRN